MAALSGATVAGLGSAVLYPEVDTPAHVDGIVVVAGADDDRYAHARHLVETGVAGEMLVSFPPTDDPSLAALDAIIAAQCRAPYPVAPDGRVVPVDCFRPDQDTTEGEATAATRIAASRGWRSMLVVTYWGHVSRVRLYFRQCSAGDVFVTDTPRPSAISRRYALLHESGGYVKALLSPAC